ncbi:MAG: hypothetical protein ACQEP7_05485 [bacterium]
MGKKEFIEQQNLNSALVEEAWEEAGGNKNKAKKLLQPAKLWVKGRFGGGDRSGLFVVEFNCRKKSVYNLDCVVVARKNMEGASPRLSPGKFGKNIKNASKSSDKIESATSKLQSALEDFWKDENSRVRETVRDQEFESLPNLHHSLLDDALDFKVENKEITFTLRRVIDQEEETDRSEDEEVVLSCEVSINPVAGLNFSKLNKGDEILVSLKDPGGGSAEQNAYKKAMKRSNTKGLVPAKLISGKSTGTGNVVLEMEIMPGIRAQTKCGRDVSIMVTDETAQKRNIDTGGSSLKSLRDNILPIFMLLGAVILLILAVIYLF